MTFTPHTPEDVALMLEAIGVADIEELFADIPEKVRLASAPGPATLSEHETLRLMEQRALANRPAGSAYVNFLGAGSYEHTIPSAVQALVQRGEFLTAYTPYQPEASQGTLQVIYEFQSMICALTGMEVANASMYDGASALAEAALMAMRATGRDSVVLPATLNPLYAAVVRTYLDGIGAKIVTWGSPADGTIDPAQWPADAEEPAALVIAQPNFYGWLEDAAALAEAAHARGALVIAVVNPMSLSVLTPPGEWGADIAVGEAQPVGIPMQFGGPYAGFMAARKEQIRRMPGRIVGMTTDLEGRPGYVLTLQTREQHIRREKATSNICTNQGLCATMVAFWLALIGREGFVQLGQVNLARAGRLHDELIRLKGVEAFGGGGAFFNEFAVRLPIGAEEFNNKMRAAGILPGLPAARLGHPDANLLVVCATETRTEADIDLYIQNAKSILEGSR